MKEKRNYGNIALAFLVVLILALMIVPMPTVLLDFLLTLNIAVSAVLLMTALYVTEPLKIASFPTMLLVATMFRLGLNVTSTRLILLNADAGKVIGSFGNFVVAGNFVVGAIVFLILVIIQFIVIAKGSERVAEVAARFTLDAMPGKQMAIDAELRFGHITYEEARIKRNNLQRESQLYGAMDGAMKFVKGDAVAGLIITFINITGGLIVGTMQMGMPVSEAVSTYSVLTVGDGLVSAIPSLLISLGAGFIITRVASENKESDLGQEMVSQISEYPVAIMWVGGVLVIMGLIPGMPALPFLISGIVISGLGFKLSRSRKKTHKPSLIPEPEDSTKEEHSGTGHVSPLAKPVSVFLSTSLSELKNTQIDGEYYLRDILFNEVRNGIFRRLGVPIPLPDINISSALPENAYSVQINGFSEASGFAEPDKTATDASFDLLKDKGISPSGKNVQIGNRLFYWISPEDSEKLAFDDVLLLPPSEFIAFHLEYVVLQNIHEILDMDTVGVIVKAVEKVKPALVEACYPAPVSLPKLTEVCKKLVEEGIPVKAMDKILDTLRKWIPKERDSVILSEYVRMELKKHINAEFSVSGMLPVWLVSGDTEDEIRVGIKRENDMSYLAMDPEITEALQDKAKKLKEAMSGKDTKLILLCSMDVRRFLRQLLAVVLPDVVVLSYQELDPKINIQPLGEF